MLEAEKMSVARAEMWGEGFSKSSISAQFLTIQTGPTFNVVVGFDRFSEDRPGLFGAFVATQSKEGFKAVGNSFFFHFGSPDSSTTFDAWLERNLKLALVKRPADVVYVPSSSHRLVRWWLWKNKGPMFRSQKRF